MVDVFFKLVPAPLKVEEPTLIEKNSYLNLLNIQLHLLHLGQVQANQQLTKIFIKIGSTILPKFTFIKCSVTKVGSPAVSFLIKFLKLLKHGVSMVYLQCF